MRGEAESQKAQIAFEFIVVYSFVLVVFLVFFAIILSQRAASLNAQGYSAISIVAQNVAGYIDQAVYSGNGYNVTVALAGGVGVISYGLNVSTTGVVIASINSAGQITTAQAFSAGRNLIINGTASITGNGITIYSVPTYTGFISIYNSRGVIYINEVPPSTSSLVTGLQVSRLLSTGAAGFSSATNSLAFNPIFTPLNNLSSYTITAWVDPSSFSNNLLIYSENALPTTYKFGIFPNNALFVAAWNNKYASNGNWVYANSPLSLTANTWSFVALSVSNAGSGPSGTFTFYRNTTANALTGAFASQAENTPIPSNSAIGGITGANSPSNTFNGNIINLQIYNTPLSGPSLNALYAEGINGAPVNSANLIAWYQLNGNTNDYSGGGNSDSGLNISYSTVDQVTVRGLVPSGVTANSNALIAFAASAGAFGAPAPYNALVVTLNGGYATGLLTTNTLQSNANLTITGFNGNVSTQGSLVGWWPLNEGSGSFVHGLSYVYASGFYPGGSGSMISWQRVVNSTSFLPVSVTSSFNAVILSSNSLMPWALNSIISNNTFTTVAWIKYGGPTASGCQAILGNLPASSSNGFELFAGGATCNVLEVSGAPTALVWPSTSANQLPSGSWQMVTAQYNGKTGQASVYINNASVFASAYIGSALGLSRSGNFVIGAQPSGTSVTNPFNGLITNVQLYASQLSTQQIGYLYSQGATGVPIQVSGLAAWWPLDGAATNYANGNAIITNAVPSNSFISSAFSNYSSAGTRYAAAFNGKNSIITISNNALLDPVNSITLEAWILANNNTQHGTIIAKSGQYSLKYANATGLNFSVFSGSTVCGTANSGNTIKPFLSPGAWYEVTATYNDPKLSLYVDGQQLYSSNVPCTSMTPNTNNLGIGNTIGASNPFNGLITDVQVYNSALTYAQVQQLYIAGFPPYIRLNNTQLQ